MNIKNADLLFADNPNPMWIYNPSDLSIKQANDAACKLYGYSKDEFSSLTITDLRPESEIPKLKEEVSNLEDTYNDAGRWKHQKKNGDILFVHVQSHPISEGNNRYRLVTVQDVTNTMQYRQEFQLLLENSLDGIMLTGPDGHIYKANDAACDILGMSEEQLIEVGREGIVHNDEKLQRALEKRKRTGKFSGELTFVHSSGRQIPVELSSSVYTNPQGEQRTSLIFRDITERKETEQKLQDIVSHSTNMFYRHGPDHKLTYVSPQSEEFLGCSPEEAKQQWTEFLTDHPTNQEGIKHTEKAIETGEKQPPFELQLQKKTGERIWVKVNEAPIVEDGETVAIVGSLTDITQQKQYEQQLEEHLERYTYARKATNDVVYEWDIEDDTLYLGEAFKTIFGHSTGSNGVPLEEYTQFVHPEDHPEAQQSLDRTLKDPSKHHWNHEYRLKKSDGEYAIVIENGYILRNEEGVAIRLIGAIRDVTEQRELEQLLEQAYRMARIGVWELDLEQDTLYWSPITKELHDVDPDFEPDLETGISFYKEGESRTTIKEAVEKAIADGEPWDEELQIVTANGNERWVRSKGDPEIVEGECRRLYGVFQDIHDRKQAELDLRRTSRIMKDAQEIAHLGSFEYIVADQTTIWSEEEYRIYGLDPNGPSPDYHEMLEKCIHPDDAKLLDDTFMTAMKNEEVYEQEHRIVRPNGDVRWVHNKAHPYFDQDGNLLRYVGATLDITDRKQNQIELEKAYQEKEIILESIEDGFFTVNRNWIVTYWNSATERMLQTPKETILGEHLWDVFDDAKDLPSYTNYHKVMEEGVSVDFEDYYAPLDRWYDISAYPSAEGISVYFKNITEQKRKEEQLQKSLKEKETLLAEIHHRVKNNLAVVSSMMQLQAFEESDQKLKQKLHDSVSRIHTMGTIHELLYQSESFSSLAIDKNIKKLVTDISHTFQPNVDLDISYDIEKINLNINQALPVSLIINEVVTNVFKHAFDGKEEGTLQIAMNKKKDNITLRISDNGKGLPPNFHISKDTGSLGIQLIDTLSQQLEGNYKYESNNGETQFMLTFTKADVKGSSNALGNNYE